MDSRAWLSRALAHGLRQPDARSCGAAVLVVARMLNDVTYAEYVVTGTHPVTGHILTRHRRPARPEERFATEVLAMHRRSTRSITVSGSAQLPWPRALGTPPWALAAQMSGPHGSGRGGTYRAHWAWPGRREALLDAARAALAAGEVLPLVVGSCWLPRHVVLVTGGRGGSSDHHFGVYDPAIGGTRQANAAAFTAGALGLGPWSTPWALVLPHTRYPQDGATFRRR